MIDDETRGQIVRLLLVEKWSVNAIARHFSIHHSTVTNALTRAGLPAVALPRRKSLADPYLPFMQEQLTKYPDLLASRLHEMVRQRGYTGTLVDRLVHRAEILTIDGESYRLKEANERKVKQAKRRRGTREPSA